MMNVFFPSLLLQWFQSRLHPKMSHFGWGPVQMNHVLGSICAILLSIHCKLFESSVGDHNLKSRAVATSMSILSA